jgi:hypothetical protein
LVIASMHPWADGIPLVMLVMVEVVLVGACVMGSKL